MKSMLKVGLKLALICGVAAVTLGFVNSITEPKIAEYKRKQHAEALSAVVTKGKPGEEVPVTGHAGVEAYYPVLEGGLISGYVLKLTGNGYGGDMSLLAFYEKSGTIIAVRLTENQETPGLGKEAEKDAYMLKFLGMGGDSPVPSRKSDLEQKDADSITGSTITFIGIAKALESGSDFVRTLED